MPITIGTLTSNVTVADTETLASPELIERIVRMVMERMEERRRDEEASRREREIRGRMSESESF